MSGCAGAGCGSVLGVVRRMRPKRHAQLARMSSSVVRVGGR